MPHPVPKPRHSRQTAPSPQPSPPVPKPRTIRLVSPSPPEERTSPAPPLQENGSAGGALESRPKQSLRKLQLTDEERSELVDLQSLSLDSDSETPGRSSSCPSSSAGGSSPPKPATPGWSSSYSSSSSATARDPSPPKPAGLEGREEKGYWRRGTGALQVRGKMNRRCLRRKGEPGVQSKVRSKFSPWNLSSPRLSRGHRLSVHNRHPGRAGQYWPHVLLESESYS